jgi:hypothetical protein
MSTDFQMKRLALLIIGAGLVLLSSSLRAGRQDVPMALLLVLARKTIGSPNHLVGLVIAR